MSNHRQIENKSYMYAQFSQHSVVIVVVVDDEMDDDIRILYASARIY